MAKYKWPSPRHWLNYTLEELATKAENGDKESLNGIVRFAQSLAGRLDGDSIEDLFQEEMDEDGYFEEGRPAP